MKFKYMTIFLLGIFLIGFSQVDSSVAKRNKPPRECDCPFTQEDLDELIDRIMLLESGEVLRFKDMGDGTIRDNYSMLIWLKDASCPDLAGTDPPGMANWYTAVEAAAVLSDGTCGLTDGSEAGHWRLPTKLEWEAFMSTVYDNPALVNTVGDAQWSEGNAFTGVQPYEYWSITQSKITPEQFWAASTYYGTMFSDQPYNLHFVWPLRQW